MLASRASLLVAKAEISELKGQLASVLNSKRSPVQDCSGVPNQPQNVACTCLCVDLPPSRNRGAEQDALQSVYTDRQPQLWPIVPPSPGRASYKQGPQALQASPVKMDKAMSSRRPDSPKTVLPPFLETLGELSGDLDNSGHPFGTVDGHTIAPKQADRMQDEATEKAPPAMLDRAQQPPAKLSEHWRLPGEPPCNACSPSGLCVPPPLRQD